MKEHDFMKKVAAAVARNRSKRAFDRSMMHPQREWFIGVGGVILGVAIAAFWSVTNYVHFSSTSVTADVSDAGMGIYNGGMVTSALTTQEERAAEYSALKNAMLGRRAPVAVPEPLPLPDVVNESPADVGSATDASVEPEASAEVEVVPEVVAVPELGV
jgi:hypothetical protein